MLGWEVTGAMKSTFAGTKSTGPLNSVSATLNTAAERARHMKTSPHVDSTARMVPISSNVQSNSIKKKTSTPTLFANQSSQSSGSTQ